MEPHNITFGDWCLCSENVYRHNVSVRSSESLIHFGPVLEIYLLFCSLFLSIAPVYVTLCCHLCDALYTTHTTLMVKLPKNIWVKVKDTRHSLIRYFWAEMSVREGSDM